MGRSSKTQNLVIAGSIAIVTGVGLIDWGGQLASAQLALLGVVALISGALILQLVVIKVAVTSALESFFDTGETDSESKNRGHAGSPQGAEHRAEGDSPTER